MSRVMQSRSSSVFGAGRRQRQTVSIARRIVGALSVWTLRRRTRKSLADLDPHLLKDIGITAFEARTEATRPFWQG